MNQFTARLPSNSRLVTDLAELTSDNKTLVQLGNEAAKVTFAALDGTTLGLREQCGKSISDLLLAC